MNSMNSSSTEQEESNAAPLVSAAQQSSSSPEAAGVVRGALRSIRRPLTTNNLFRRGAVGRLPVRRVRRISDSASKGLDLVSNITESIGEGSPKKTFRGFFADWTTKSVVFAKVFIKNTILGTAVFDSYVKLIEISQSSTIHQMRKGNNDSNLEVVNKGYQERNVPLLPIHFAAGAIAGSLHSILSLAFNALETRSLPTPQMARSSTLHHALAHSILFGFYELTKRRITCYYNSYTVIHNPVKDDYSEDKKSGKATVYSYEVASVAISGGVAGVMQSVCSHYTGMWLHVDDYVPNNSKYNAVNSAQNESVEKNKLIMLYRNMATRLAHILQPLPPMRSTVLIPFPIMAVAFLAFEYGSPD